MHQGDSSLFDSFMHIHMFQANLREPGLDVWIVFEGHFSGQETLKAQATEEAGIEKRSAMHTLKWRTV